MENGVLLFYAPSSIIFSRVFKTYLNFFLNFFPCHDLEIAYDRISYGPRREKTCLRRFANNTGADQPAHPRSLISAFVVHFLESSIC